MKFDVVVGNPPYQENDNGRREDGTANASASPLYDKFFYLAEKLSRETVSLIFPARWLTGAGKGLGDFSKKLLASKNVKSLSLFLDSSKVFANTDIKGGVLYLIYDQSYEGQATITLIEKNGSKSTSVGYLNSSNSGVFIPFPELVSIYEKVSSVDNLEAKSMQKIVSSRKPYGLTTDFFKNPSKYGLPPISMEKESGDDIEIIGLEKMKRVSKFVPQEYPLPSGNDLVSNYKVFSPYAYGSGSFGEIAGTLILGRPNQISTETFLVIGPCDTEYEAKGILSYYKTKFFRAMIGILKSTQHSTTAFRFVPLQNFTQNSDIDWSRPISEIDQQLYKKYGLSKEEIDFIETKVKAME